jgi:hypothetical protein
MEPPEIDAQIGRSVRGYAIARVGLDYQHFAAADVPFRLDFKQTDIVDAGQKTIAHSVGFGIDERLIRPFGEYATIESFQTPGKITCA